MTQQTRTIVMPGGNPASRKIERVTGKLGLAALNKQQGTHRVIFDTLPLVVSAEQQTLRFFKNVQTRQFPFSNLNQNKLDAGETMAIERMFLFLLRNQSNVLPNDVTDIQSVQEVFEFARLNHSLFNLSIAQKSVTKDIYMGSGRGTFNYKARFNNPTPNPILAATLVSYGHAVFHFETPFVLPPDLEFEATLQIGAISAVPAAGSYRLGIAFEGLGGIYDPKAAL